LGPATEPTVVAHTTTAMVRARTSGATPSAAAYRVCRLQAEATPKRQNPAMTRASCPAVAAATTRAAPRAAIA
jgi:hypothetical protein